MEFFNNKNFKKVGEIYNFEIKDEKTVKVRNFYKEDPFPNYEIDDNKLTILNAGDANQFTKSLKKFIDHKKIVLEIGAGTSQLSNYLSIGNNNLLIAFDGNLESLKIGNTFCEKNSIKNVPLNVVSGGMNSRVKIKCPIINPTIPIIDALSC